MDKTIALIITGICMLICCTISISQFMQRGFLSNNAYIYAAKEERKKMNKKPYYKQSGIVFALLTAIFFVIGLEVYLETGWLWWVEGILVAAVLVYAVASTWKRGKTHE